MRASIKLGSVLGIPLGINYSWFIVLAVITYTLAELFQRSNPDWSSAERWIVAGATSIFFFLSILAHELSHSVLAIRKGIPVKGITLFIFGGVSQIAREAHRPGTELLIAGIGPFSSLILGVIFLGLHFVLRDVSDHLSTMAETLAFVNISLGIFNMLPGFPLDGGRVLRSIIWGVTGNYWRATRIATRGGQVMAFLMIAGGLALIYFGEVGQGIWITAVGWFLAMASSASYKQFQFHQRLQGYSAQDLMSTDSEVIPTSMTLETLAKEHALPTGGQFYLVTEDGRSRGMITASSIRQVSWDRLPYVTVESVMQPLDDILTVGAEENGFQVLEIMEEQDAHLALVLQDDRLLGFISRESLLRSVRSRRIGRPNGGKWAPQP